MTHSRWRYGESVVSPPRTAGLTSKNERRSLPKLFAC
jgi:hypothetical protein